MKELDDVPDLMLWRQYLRGRHDEYEHLVIELKRPKKTIGQDEIVQVKKYANKVMENRDFDKLRTRWTFIALSDGVAEDAEGDVNQRDRRPGHVTSGKNFDIWVRTWPEVIQDAKFRLTWIRERLDIKVTSDSEGMDYMRAKYAHLLPKEAHQPAMV